MISNWREFFPHESVRPQQEEALDAIVEAFSAEKRFAVCSIGTGVGKSAIAVTLSRWIAANFPVNLNQDSGGVIVTSQKSLQDQYQRDFSKISSDLRSSSNYPCLWVEDLSCAAVSRLSRASGDWPCSTSSQCMRGTECPYKVSKLRYKSSTVGITNYSYLMAESIYGKSLQQRQLLVGDECHQISSEVRRFNTVTADDIFAKELNVKIPNFDSSDEVLLKWLRDDYFNAIANTMEKNVDMIMTYRSLKKKLPKEVWKMVKFYEELDKRICQLNRWKNDITGSKDNYILVKSENNNIKTIELKPLDVSKSCESTLFKCGEKVLLMSATILDFESFAAECGIKKSESKYIDIQSPFDPHQFGIVYRPKGLMSRASLPRTLPKVVKEVKKILAAHPTEKGVIHCCSYLITEAIGELNDPRLLIQKNGNREEILRLHKESTEPTVIVSPSMMEGLDLYDDFGRFQVICKIPFPFLGDPVVAKLLERSQRWYAWKTALTLVQAVGRCVRSKDDWAKTYILDESFGGFFMKWSSFFTNAFSEMDIEK